MYFPDIASDYGSYRDFLDEKKSISNSPIIISSKPNNLNWVKGESSFSSMNDVRLIVQVMQSNSKYFGFQVIAGAFGIQPCFRFDSDGPAHNNSLPSIPLSDRQVTTPHFHKVHESGYLFAFKTAKLQDENEKNALISDINLAIAHFSFEGNIRDNNADLPLIAEAQESLDLKVANEDPLSGINFEMGE